MHGTLPKKIKIQTSFAKGKEKWWPKDIQVAQPFVTAIIDPDWPYTAGFSEDHSGYTRNKKGKNIYAQEKPLSIDELASLPIGDVVGGYVFLWVVGPFLIGNPFGKEKEPITAAYKVLRKWGFKPCSILTWAKYDLKNGHGYGGVGYWFLGNAEFCIVGKREGFPSIRTGKSSLIVAPKTKHSAKPDDIHKLCEERFPGPWLEVFGRKKRDEWTVIGNEAPGYEGEDIRDSLTRLVP